MPRLARALFTAALVCGAAAQAQSSDPLARRHQGFFFRGDLGVGYFRTTATNGLQDVTLSGGGGALGVNVGASLAENLILSANLWSATAVAPTVSAGGSSTNLNQSFVSLIALGPSLTYYAMPANVYLTGTAGFGKLSVSKNNPSSTSMGPHFRFSLGKEWWTTDQWGLGMAAVVSLGANRDDGADNATWHTVAASFSFSATYN